MTPTYTIIGQVQLSKWLPELQQAVPGWDITVRWTSPPVTFHVFVDEQSYNATNVDAAIRDQGSKVGAVSALGQGSPPPPTTTG